MASLQRDFVTVPSSHSGGGESVKIEVVYHQPVPPSNGRPALLFLPHWGGTASTYEPLQTYLAEQNFALPSISLSYPGTGKSSRNLFITEVDGSIKRSQVQALATLVQSVLSSLSSRGVFHLSQDAGIVFVGHSMGAKVALSLLPLWNIAKVPIKGILLVAPAPPIPLVLPADLRKNQLTAYNSVENARFAVENIMSLGRLGKERVAALVEDAVSMTAEAKQAWINHGMAEDIRPNLAKLSTRQRVPLKVVVGHYDRVETYEKVERETVEELRGLGFEILAFGSVDDCAHLVTVEQPALLAEEIKSFIGYE